MTIISACCASIWCSDLTKKTWADITQKIQDYAQQKAVSHFTIEDIIGYKNNLIIIGTGQRDAGLVDLPLFGSVINMGAKGTIIVAQYTDQNITFDQYDKQGNEQHICATFVNNAVALSATIHNKSVLFIPITPNFWGKKYFIQKNIGPTTDGNLSIIGSSGNEYWICNDKKRECLFYKTGLSNTDFMHTNPQVLTYNYTPYTPSLVARASEKDKKENAIYWTVRGSEIQKLIQHPETILESSYKPTDTSNAYTLTQLIPYTKYMAIALGITSIRKSKIEILQIILNETNLTYSLLPLETPNDITKIALVPNNNDDYIIYGLVNKNKIIRALLSTLTKKPHENVNTAQPTSNPRNQSIINKTQESKQGDSAPPITPSTLLTPQPVTKISNSSSSAASTSNTSQTTTNQSIQAIFQPTAPPQSDNTILKYNKDAHYNEFLEIIGNTGSDTIDKQEAQNYIMLNNKLMYFETADEATKVDVNIINNEQVELVQIPKNAEREEVVQVKKVKSGIKIYTCDETSTKRSYIFSIDQPRKHLIKNNICPLWSLNKETNTIELHYKNSSPQQKYTINQDIAQKLIKIIVKSAHHGYGLTNDDKVYRLNLVSNNNSEKVIVYDLKLQAFNILNIETNDEKEIGIITPNNEFLIIKKATPPTEKVDDEYIPIVDHTTHIEHTTKPKVSQSTSKTNDKQTGIRTYFKKITSYISSYIHKNILQKLINLWDLFWNPFLNKN